MANTTFLKAALIAGFIIPPILEPLADVGLGITKAYGQDIYLDETTGNDATGNGTIGTPWKSISKLNQQYPSGLPSNSTLHLGRGGTYTGQINVAGGAQSVGIEAYPLASSLARPIVYGSEQLTSWTQVGTSGVWYAQLASGIFPKYLFQNGQRQTIARFPNTGWLRNANCVNGGGSSTIQPSVATPFPTNGDDLLNAELVARTYNWQYQLSTVTGVGTGPVTAICTPAVQNMGSYDWGFFFQGTLPLLDAIGEWCFVDAEDRVYYKTGGTSAPPGVRVAYYDFGVNINGGSPYTQDILVQEVEFAHQVSAGVVLRGANSGAHGVEVRNCHFHDMQIGFHDRNSLHSSAANNVHHNTFTDVYDRAILNYEDGSSITHNVFLRIGMVPGLGKSGFGGSMGMEVGGQNYTVDQNSFHTIGYAGINAGGKGSITHNHLEGCLSMLNDGGSIQFDFSDQMVIAGNVIINMGDPLVNLESVGSVNANGTAYFAYEQISYGIYFGDKQITNATVQNNVVSGCDKGIHVDHSLCSTNQQVLNNTLFNNRVQLSMTDYSNYTTACGGDGDFSAGNQGLGPAAGYPNYRAAFNDTYTGNVTYCLSGAQKCLEQGHVWPGAFAALVDFGAFSDNHYHNPFSEAPFIITTKHRNATFGNAQFDYPLSLAEWQSLEEAGAQGSTLTLSDHSITASGAPVLNESFGPSLSPLWQCNLPGSRTTLEEGVGSGDYAMQSTGSPWLERVAVCPPTVGSTAGKYEITFDMSSSVAGSFLAGYRYRDIGGYLGCRTFTANTTPRSYSLLVDVADPPGNDWNWFYIVDGQFGSGLHTSSSILIDNVQVKPATIDPDYTTNTIAANHILRYHAPLPGTEADPQNTFANGGSFELIGCWSDVYGNIHSGTVTLAPWESVVLYRLEDAFDIDVAQYNVQGNEVWTTDKKVRGSIVIADQRSLTINGATIHFADSRQDAQVLTNIVVMPGGTLNLINGAHLTTLDGCGANSMWDGVKCYGNVDPNAPQGMVKVYSGSRISNSLTGILGGEGDPANPGFAGPTKNGHVDIRDAFFENNVHDVVLHGLPSGQFFLEYWDVPFFQNTQFLTTAPLNYEGLGSSYDALKYPKSHVRVADHGQSIFLGCTFANDLPNHTQSLRMGLGIEGFNANIAVWGNGAGSSTFRNLDHAIHNMASAGAPYSNIIQSTFTDNICAVYMKDVPGFAIRGNTVEMGRWDLGDGNYTNIAEEFWLNYHRAFFVTGSNAFSITDNTLERSTGGTAPLEGIVVGYTGAENEVVFRNSASDLDAAYVGEGECADVNGDPNIAGLQFQCNTNSNNAVNIKSRSANGDELNLARHTIRGRQGTPSYSASNAFDGALHFEVRTKADAIEYIEYSHGAGDAPTTYTQQDPNDQDADYLAPVLVSSGIGCPTGEPVWTTGTGGTFTEVKPNLTASKVQYGNLRYQLEQLIDGGNTDEIVEEIVEAWPQEILDLRTSLLAKSPYLSVDVLKSLMTKPGVPDAIRAEVLIANPDATKKEGFLKWAELEAPYPLPGYLADAVEASWNNRTYRTTLEESVADKHTRLTQLVGRAIHLLQTDTVPPPPDTLRWVWQQLRTNRARYSEAALLIGQGKLNVARAVIEAMPAEKDQKAPEEQERQRMLTYIDVLTDAASDGRNAYQLTAAEVAELETMVGTHYDRPANWVSNLLCAVYGKCRAPYTGDVEIPKANRIRERRDEPLSEASSAYGLQPNPARNWVAFNYDLGDGGSGNGQIILRTLDGRVITSLLMNGAQGQRVWDTRGIAPGTYVVQYLRGEELVHTEKLIIQQ